MNILMLSWRGPGHPHFGGAEINTLENVTAWAKAGHKVVWFTSTFPGGSSLEVINEVEIIRRGSQNFGVHIATFFWYLHEPHLKFDVVVDQFHGIPFFTPLYMRIPKLGFIHEVAQEVWWLNPWPKPFNLIPAIAGSLIEPIMFRLIYSKIPFMTVSESTRSDLVKYGIPNENVSVFLSGLILKSLKPNPSKNRIPTVIYLGALSKDKGIEDALKAFSKISRLRPQWKMWVVGKGDPIYQGYLEKMCKELKIDRNVKFWGFVSSSQKYELLARAHVLINPSVREGWGLVNIEANAMGTPVVGYDAPGTRDSVRHLETGILVPLHSFEMMAEKVIELIENPKKYKKLATNGIRWSKQFSWDKFTRQSLDLLTRIYTMTN